VSSRTEPSSESWPATLAQHIDQVCLAFEAAWKKGERPRIEDYLATVMENERGALLGELLGLELAYRQACGEEPARTEYQLRFAAYAECIEEAFRKQNQRPLAIPLSKSESSLPAWSAAGHVAEAAARFAPQSVPETTDSVKQPTGTPELVEQAPLDIPGYEVLGVLGRGGMGVVYKARQVRLNRVVALKMIRDGHLASAEGLARFPIEAEVVARLQHPNIVQIHEVGDWKGQPFFALEFVEGGSLAQKLQHTPLSDQDAAALVRTLALAMHAAHRRGIVHRDLKPGNVLLTAEGLPKITDFGLAKRLDVDGGQTHTGALVGTPSYMAPEQAQGKSNRVTPLTDVYALGAILYEALTGRPPFRGSSVMDTLNQVVCHEPVSPSRLQPKLPRDLETICLKCLRKLPEQRYASAAALAGDLSCFLAGEPIQARPIPPWVRALKWAQRRPAVAALVAVGMLGLPILLGTVLGLQQQHQADLTIKLEETRNELEQAHDAQAAGEERARRETLRAKAEALTGQGREALNREDWAGAAQQFRSVLATIEVEPMGSELRARFEHVRDELRRLNEARQQVETFRVFHNQAVFHETLLTGLDPTTNRKETYAAADKALAVFRAADPVEGEFHFPDAYLSAAERAEIARGCYEMLLVLAEAVGHPETDRDPARQADEALRILDRATRLGLPLSQAYYWRRSRYLGQKGDRAAAEEASRQAGAMTPAGAFDFFLAGQERYKQGALAQAVRDFENVLQLEPDHFWAQYFLAACYLGMSPPQPQLAVARLDTCAALNSKFAWIYLLRGLAHMQLREFNDAAIDYRKALECGPDPAARYAIHLHGGLLRIEEAKRGTTVAMYAQAIAALPGLDLALVCAGPARVQSECKLAEAVEELQQAARLKPNQFQAYATLAQAYQQQRKPARALEQLGEAIRRAPELSRLYYERALLHEQQQNPKAALRDVEQAIDVERRSDGRPENLTAYHLARGRILFRQKLYEETIEACGAALEVNPNSAEVHLLCAKALLQRSRYSEVLAALDGYEKTGHPSAEVCWMRGQACAHLHLHTEAVDAYTQALRLAADPRSRVARGWEYLIVFETPKLALVDFREAIRLDSSNGDAYNGRGFAQAQLGLYREAVADAVSALRLSAPSARTHYMAARIYAQAAGAVAASKQEGAWSRRSLQLEYRERALALLQSSMSLLPDRSQRARFWEEVDKDPALNSIRQTPEFARLAKEFSAPGR
jgi:tetratricopeptide (TPR) repeat protein